MKVLSARPFHFHFQLPLIPIGTQEENSSGVSPPNARPLHRPSNSVQGLCVQSVVQGQSGLLNLPLKSLNHSVGRAQGTAGGIHALEGI